MVFSHLFSHLFLLFVGMVVVESFSHFYQEIIAYWPIVIILTEHSLSSCIGTYPSKCWYLSIIVLRIRINILCILVMVYSVGINLQKYNVIIKQ